MITQITYQKFLGFQRKFKLAVDTSISTAKITYLGEKISAGTFADFTGDSKRTEKVCEIKCLYKRDFEKAQRIKYGLREAVSGVVWLSPINLKDATGKTTFDVREIINVFVGDKIYAVDNVINRSPHYGTCISVEIHLTEPTNV